MYLRAGCEAEYKTRHDQLWPELAEHLKAQGISNYYIHLYRPDNLLYASFDAEALDTKALAEHPVMQRWWLYMADIMETKAPSYEPVANSLEEVFRFNVQQPVKPRVVAVLDIGKTNLKICLMDAQTGALLNVAKRCNQVIDAPPYPHVDEQTMWTWIKNQLKSFASQYYVLSISITTHGATVACMSGNELALPILDYEYDGVAEFNQEYDVLRPRFKETYSPNLPQGLNLGRQLFWQAQRFPELFKKVDCLLLYPQYWGFKLSGSKAAEVTSLGCHTDLWQPNEANYSGLVESQGWSHLFPDILDTGARLGTILPELAQELDIPEECVVFNGLHDSNASLVPYINQSKEKLTIISSGTWTVMATINGDLDALVEGADMLANVDAFGRATPTIRFMGGREWEFLRGDEAATLSDVVGLIDQHIFPVPAFAKGGGPFAYNVGYIIKDSVQFRLDALSQLQRSAVADLYVALMSDYCLELAQASDTIIVEGAFSNNANYLSVLAALRPNSEIYASRDVTGTSGGAAILSNKVLTLKNRLLRISPNDELCKQMQAYRIRWQERLPAETKIGHEAKL